ncbi:2-C-methyl-D-erythritol 4-phosphate cytidylyltransferase [soil metagenome]|nr:2-C-methyl-D-erythritol 4-phosphate cytidylyltransferase [Gemmatimonadota bacterium]
MSQASSPASFHKAAPQAAAVIVAGGSGRRMGSDVRKQYLQLAGRPVLYHAVLPFLRHTRIGEVVVVLPEPDAADPPEWLSMLEVQIVAGGLERSDSVRNGLRATRTGTGIVVIHDGARPFVSGELINRVLDAAGTGSGAIAAVRVTDTIKDVDPDGTIRGTPDRARLWQAQTPQAFPHALVLAAHERALEEGVGGTDDAALIERFGGRVVIVEGATENLKITRPRDLVVAEALAPHLLGG